MHERVDNRERKRRGGDGGIPDGERTTAVTMSNVILVSLRHRCLLIRT